VIFISLLPYGQACYSAGMSTTRRPRRGTPAETRARLVAAAREIFDRDGYYRTDSNRIAAAAGYAAGTFYKHFADKREVLLAAYQRWIDEEWGAVERELGGGGSRAVLAERIVALVARMHVRGRGLRSALLAQLATDAEVRRFYRAQRKRQLDSLAALRERAGATPRPREADAVLLFTLERSCDALANGEQRDLRLGRAATLRVLAELVEEALR
jgi:AcrR family transcriptional regulator